MKFFMENNKITIITILTVGILIITFGGITYAFFTANNPKGSTAEIKSETGRMLITYNDGTDNIVPVTNIQPSNEILVNKTFTLTGSNTTVGTSSSDGLSMPYKVGLKYTSTFSNGMLHYYIKKVEDKSDADVTANYVIKPETGKTEDDYINQTVLGNPTYTGYVHGTFKTGSNNTNIVSGEFPASLNNKKITFNLILQFPDNNENQDSEKGKTFNGRIVINYEPSFKDDSWKEIANNVRNGEGKFYKIGDEKEVIIDDKCFSVRLANNSTPDECSGTDFSQTACGFVVEFVDIVEKLQMNSTNTNIGSWPASTLRSYANRDFFDKLPSDLQDAITETKVISGYGSSEKENLTSTDKIYLLAPKEINITNGSDTARNLMRVLDYYVDKTNSDRIKKFNNSNSIWWLRNAAGRVQTLQYPFGVTTVAGAYSIGIPTATNGFVPAFRIG